MHDEFKTQALTRLQEEYPDAAILVHPESPQAIVDMADAVGSTSQLIAAAKTLPHQRLIVATDRVFSTKCSRRCQIKSYWKHQPQVRVQPAAAARIVRGWP